MNVNMQTERIGLALREKLHEVLHSEKSTANNRRIAEYILTHQNSIVFMTASELAENVGVSQPTVTRFVTNTLGFQSFSHFMKVIQEIVRNEITGVDRYQISSGKKHSNMEILVNREIENLTKLLEENTEEKLNRIAQQIAKAKTICILGFRTGSPLALYFHFFLRKIHPDVRVCTNGGSEVYDILHKLDRDSSLVIAFAFPRYPREIIEVIQFLKQEKFSYFTITDSYTLENWGITECTIVTPMSMSMLFDSYVTSFCMLSLLLDMIGRVDLDRTREMLDSFEKVSQRKQIFFKKG
ncbi:MurR/RpiR family transcriptional regulator [Aeribacillus sp. FSL K6-8210]|uniref:MurR/RpiR family transcriptional regulator n=1 Tax=Aeribacillus sp. FSL K6-8210 TaxID=2954683 RepID=UPI0030CD5CCF